MYLQGSIFHQFAPTGCREELQPGGPSEYVLRPEERSKYLTLSKRPSRSRKVSANPSAERSQCLQPHRQVPQVSARVLRLILSLLPIKQTQPVQRVQSRHHPSSLLHTRTRAQVHQLCREPLSNRSGDIARASDCWLLLPFSSFGSLVHSRAWEKDTVEDCLLELILIHID